MADFSQQIANFTNYGTYDYKFDVVGNEILNQSSSVFQQVYFSLPLRNYNYNNSKILSFYNPEFTEFLPAVDSSSIESLTISRDNIDEINKITHQNTQLKGQLDALIAASQNDMSSANTQSTKNIITNLRIQLGQGITEKDFQDTYPYLPNPIESQLAPIG